MTSQFHLTFINLNFRTSACNWTCIEFVSNIFTSKVLRSPPWLGWPSWNSCATSDHGYVSLVVNTSWSFPHSWLITATGFVTRFTRRVHLSSPPVFSGVRVTRSLVLCVCFVDHGLSFCPFSFGHCVSIYGSWLPLWYLQTLNQG